MQSISMFAFSDCRLASLVPRAFCNPASAYRFGDQSVSGGAFANGCFRRGQRHRAVPVPLPDDGMADQHRIAEHLGASE